MTTKWYIAKYLPDVRRGEPKNVGIVLYSQGRATARFIGQTDGDSIDGRSARWAGSQENYKAWVHRWSHTASQVRTEEAFDAMRSTIPGSSYYLEKGGEYLVAGSHDASEVIQALFVELVDEPRHDQRATLLDHREAWLAEAFTELGVAPEIEQDCEVTVDGDRLRFDYRHANGIDRLFKKVNLLANERRSWGTVHEAAWSLNGVRQRARTIGFALVDPTGSIDVEAQLGVLARCGKVIDINSPGAKNELEVAFRSTHTG
jgi:hypothetical protein